MKPWYELDSDVVATQLGTDPKKGLSASEAARRLIANGPNELVEVGARSVWAIVWEQVTATMVVILIVAAVVLAALRDYLDAGVILTIVVLNAVLGFHQEFRAEKAIASVSRHRCNGAWISLGGVWPWSPA